ncbi:hypothetical protein APHAL10511_001790 [Amanita phalloides]|nr:hypothetical protein APHAL10511_001790 [Amanita phalloides]
MAQTNEELLKILEAHGREFFSSFALPLSSPDSGKRKREEPEEEEWHGIQMSTPRERAGEAEEFEHSDDDFTADSSNVVVFSEQTTNPRSDRLSKVHMRSFMSSKTTKVTSDNVKTTPVDEIEREDERSNVQNDALLHRLIHTQLLSGSLNPELNLTSAQRQKALAGRVLELAGAAKLGKGEKVVIEAERRKDAKSVREGMANKRKEREQQRLEEAKNLGNYHPAIKNVFESSFKSKSSRQRDRGLRMGVGRFHGGYLKLSKDEIKVAGGDSSGSSVNDRMNRAQRSRRR